jgi:hypothetical protein
VNTTTVNIEKAFCYNCDLHVCDIANVEITFDTIRRGVVSASENSIADEFTAWIAIANAVTVYTVDGNVSHIMCENANVKMMFFV